MRACVFSLRLVLLSVAAMTCHAGGAVAGSTTTVTLVDLDGVTIGAPNANAAVRGTQVFLEVFDVTVNDVAPATAPPELRLHGRTAVSIVKPVRVIIFDPGVTPPPAPPAPVTGAEVIHIATAGPNRPQGVKFVFTGAGLRTATIDRLLNGTTPAPPATVGTPSTHALTVPMPAADAEMPACPCPPVYYCPPPKCGLFHRRR